jgi:UDP-N-acetylglucosamine:LPS N-acetylglucosamine transferase
MANLHRPLRILITSLNAGGGHKTVKEGFINTLKDNKSFIIQDYHSAQQTFDWVYSWIEKIPYAWFSMHKFSPYILSFFGLLINLPELIGAERAIEKYNPDIIICSHAIQSLVFIDLRKKYGLKYKVITIITDYGEQKAEMHLNSKPDYYFVLDDWTKKNVEKYVKDTKTYTIGVIPNKPFMEVRRLGQARLKKESLTIFHELFPKKKHLSKRKNIVFLGGSRWTRKSLKLIKLLSKDRKYNLFISCGKDEALYNELKNNNGIFAFRFVSQNTLAILEKVADLTILSTVGTGTLLEISEINKYPIFIHKYIRGQESQNLKMVFNKIGIYENRPSKMKFLIEDFFQNKHKYKYLVKNTKKFKERIRERAENNNAVLVKIISEL